MSCEKAMISAVDRTSKCIFPIRGSDSAYRLE
jgi:hypothetical protein